VDCSKQDVLLCVPNRCCGSQSSRAYIDTLKCKPPLRFLPFYILAVRTDRNRLHDDGRSFFVVAHFWNEERNADAYRWLVIAALLFSFFLLFLLFLCDVSSDTLFIPSFYLSILYPFTNLLFLLRPIKTDLFPSISTFT
jgi:hypothetical protein